MKPSFRGPVRTAPPLAPQEAARLLAGARGRGLRRFPTGPPPVQPGGTGPDDWDDRLRLRVVTRPTDDAHPEPR